MTIFIENDVLFSNDTGKLGKRNSECFIEDTYFTKSALRKGRPTKLQIIKLIQEKQYVK